MPGREDNDPRTSHGTAFTPPVSDGPAAPGSYVAAMPDATQADDSPATEPAVRVEIFALGDLQTNASLVYDRTGGPATVVDPGQRPGPLLERIRELNLAVERVVLTHAHADHIAGLAELRDLHPGCAIEIHAAETGYLQDPENNLSAWIGQPLVAPAATGTLAGGTTTRMAGLDWHILATPGHSPGGLTFHQPDLGVAIVGDTLFAGSIGRYDFPHSDPDALRASLKRLMTLPDATRVLPGHGPETTIAAERASNPHVARG